jgi:hypothetical protein
MALQESDNNYQAKPDLLVGSAGSGCGADNPRNLNAGFWSYASRTIIDSGHCELYAADWLWTEDLKAIIKGILSFLEQQ